jgi:hypothetical protein
MQRQLVKSRVHFYRQHYTRWQLVQLRMIMSYVMLRNMAQETLQLGRGDAAEQDTTLRSLQMWTATLVGLVRGI